jgi:hypothetical protein
MGVHGLTRRTAEHGQPGLCTGPDAQLNPGDLRFR